VVGKVIDSLIKKVSSEKNLTDDMDECKHNLNLINL
jgi:hypothetical protein